MTVKFLTHNPVVFVVALFIVFAIVISIVYKKRKTLSAGYFVVTYNDEEKDLITIDLSVDLPDIERADYLLLKVKIDKKPELTLKNSQGEYF